ncbi:hypothetical protein ACJMK2_011794 [Sinanodonta woodiana]|uniref:A-kinase anchor protein 7-like phosphoesterase domain-containing protein n=1 Tax=Sinanodonta woodiana TaxID=1069815 RepID=A0ABD3V945_SINWO
MADAMPKANESRNYPNFFLSLDITDTTVKANATEVQQRIASYIPNYAKYTEPESSLHITLALINLIDRAEISRCSTILTSMEPNLAELARDVPPLNLRGVGNFGEGTIFAKVQGSRRFFDFVTVLTERLQNGGIYIIRQNAIYTPHLTLVKCPRGMRGKASPETVAQCIRRLQDVEFGTQMLDSVHLYEMGRVNNRYRETAVITLY